MRQFLFAIACLVLASGPSTSPRAADQASDGAIGFIKTLSGEVLQTMQGGNLSDQQRDDKLRAVLQRGLDLPGIGRFVLGRFWSDASAEQIGEYQSLFAAYLLGTTSRLLNQHGLSNFTVIAAGQAEDGDVLVQSRLHLTDGEPLDWVWRVREVAGELRIVDLLKDGVSLATTYRSEFGAVAASHGMDGLIKALRRQTAQAHPAEAAERVVVSALPGSA